MGVAIGIMILAVCGRSTKVRGTTPARRRLSRRTGLGSRWASLIVVLITLAAELVGCGGNGGNDAPATHPPATVAFAGSPPSAAQPPVRVGKSVVVTGNTNFARPKSPLRVTVTKVLTHPTATSFQRRSIPKGGKFVAVRMTIVNVGKATWAGQPGDDSALIDNAFEQALHGPDIERCGGPFAKRVELRPGERQRGCLVFVMPTHRRPRFFQFNPDFPASQAGEWDVGAGR